MKKSVFTALAFLALVLGACRKDYTCDCKKTRTSGGTTVITEDGKYTFNDTRSTAESRCNDQESTGSDALGSFTRNCQIQ